jgi:F0F1-type ATP synthase assembly protein I
MDRPTGSHFRREGLSYLLIGFAAGVLNVMREVGIVRERDLND